MARPKPGKAFSSSWGSSSRATTLEPPAESWDSRFLGVAAVSRGRAAPEAPATWVWREAMAVLRSGSSAGSSGQAWLREDRNVVSLGIEREQ